jgi:hypothetical protein
VGVLEHRSPVAVEERIYNCGTFVRSAPLRGSVFVAGRPIVEAYKYEQAQDWVGIMLAPSVLEASRSVGLHNRCTTAAFQPSEYSRLETLVWPACIQRCTNIPFKQEGSKAPYNYDGFAVIPGRGTTNPHEMSNAVSETRKRLDWLRTIAPSPVEQEKHRRTGQWLSDIEGKLSGYANSYELWKRSDRER